MARVLIIISIVICSIACDNETTCRSLYRIMPCDIFLSMNKEQVCISRDLANLNTPNWQANCPRLKIRKEGKAVIFIPQKDTCFFYVKDSSCISEAIPSYLGHIVWLAKNTPDSFTDTMIKVQIPCINHELFFIESNSTELKKAHRLNREDIADNPNRKFKRLGGFPNIPMPKGFDPNDFSVSFSNIGKDGKVVMNLNDDQIFIAPVVNKDAIAYWANYPKFIIYQDSPNTLFFNYDHNESYNTVIPNCEYYSVVFVTDNNRPITKKREEFEFYHSYYDVLDDDISMMDSKYKKDDVQIRVVCNNKERELCYSDEVIMNMKLAWRKQLHLWSSKKVSDSTLIKRAISPRTFFIIYRLCTGEYILGGPSYKIIENLPAGVIRIDNSNYHEADGIPLKPQDCEYTLFDNNTCSKVDIDRVIAIYETPKGPQVWYCGNIDGNRISQLESFCQ